MEDLEGHSLPKALNGKYLKCYYPSMCKTNKGDYRVQVDWWYREAKMVNGNHSM
jgi:hypothetical protein